MSQTPILKSRPIPQATEKWAWARSMSTAVLGATAGVLCLAGIAVHAADRDDKLDRLLEIVLRKAGFTGTVESTLVARLGRPIDPRMAEVGRRLFFDPVVGLHNDNACAGCHAPATGFADTQSIAIGVQNNLLVGPGGKARATSAAPRRSSTPRSTRA